MSDSFHIAVIDLETTGPDTELDDIVEVGLLLCDQSLNIVDSFQRVISPTGQGMDRLLGNDVVRSMHTESGLLAEVRLAAEAGLDHDAELARAEADALALLDRAEAGILSFAGSGIDHFDLPILRRCMPRLVSRGRYWSVDVGSMRRLYRMATGADLTPINRSKPHRALDDCGIHLTEIRAYAEVFRDHHNTPTYELFGDTDV